MFILASGIYGRGEYLRVICHMAGLEWEDVRIGDKSSEEFKALLPKLPNGYLPVLQVNGGPYMDGTLNLTRFLCQKAGLYPETPEEQFAVE